MHIAAKGSRPAEPACTPARRDFEAFVRESEPKLSRALAAAYGFEDGRDATAEALAYAWEQCPPPSPACRSASASR